MLRDLISEEGIKIDVKAENWEDAVRKGGKLLVDVKAAEEKYIDAMIDSVKEIGPYIVLTEGVAMPHARPEKGALKEGMSLITLKEPIEFGSDENDPVKLVLCFSATSDKGHLKALSQLSELLDNRQSINKIIDAKSKNDILDVINDFS